MCDATLYYRSNFVTTLGFGCLLSSLQCTSLNKDYSKYISVLSFNAFLSWVAASKPTVNNILSLIYSF